MIGDYAVVGKQPALGRARRPRATSCRRSSSATGRDRLTGAVVFAGTPARRRRDRRRPGLRARALRGRRRGRDRARLAGRERHDGRRAHEDPGERLRHRLLDPRGGRLHRARRRHDERQLHGPHREAPRAARADDPARRAGRRRRRPPPRDRDRRGGLRRRIAAGPASLHLHPLPGDSSASERSRPRLRRDTRLARRSAPSRPAWKRRAR